MPEYAQAPQLRVRRGATAKGKVARAKAKEPVPAKTHGGSTSTPDPRGYQFLGLAHCALTSPYRYLQDDEWHREIRNGSLELYQGLEPKSALESVLASLIVDVSNATHDCLSLAARVQPDALQHRAINLRHAFKGATVVTQLVDTLERLRGNRPGNVSVGEVNVESGGQAIVGTVQTDRCDQEPSETTEPDHAKTARRK